MDSALSWYGLYTKTLKCHGFDFNKYDRCTANIIIDGKQCTIDWYFYDNKVLHFDDEVNTKIIETMTKYWDELTVTR